MPLNERVCPVHKGGEHCWHKYGNAGYSGRYRVITPVECCHCGRTAEKHEHTGGGIEYTIGESP